MYGMEEMCNIKEVREFYFFPSYKGIPMSKIAEALGYPKFTVTFGVKYSHTVHPIYDYVNPDYVTGVYANSYEDAAQVTHKLFRGHYSTIYTESEFGENPYGYKEDTSILVTPKIAEELGKIKLDYFGGDPLNIIRTYRGTLMQELNRLSAELGI